MTHSKLARGKAASQLAGLDVLVPEIVLCLCRDIRAFGAAEGTGKLAA
jgi:hypothetical protein